MKAAHSRVTVRMDLYIIKGCDVTSRELQDVLFDTLIEFAPPPLRNTWAGAGWCICLAYSLFPLITIRYVSGALTLMRSVSTRYGKIYRPSRGLRCVEMVLEFAHSFV